MTFSTTLSRSTRALPGAILALALVASACGTTVTSTPTVPTTAPPTTPPTTIAASTTSTNPPTTTTIPVTTTAPLIESNLEIGDWEGELIDYGPRNGNPLVVVGVKYSDSLNVREGPGVSHAILTTLEIRASNVRALGMTWSRPESIWYGVDIDGVQGWASAKFLSQEGGTFDFKSQVVEEVGGIPSSDSLVQLGIDVANVLASEDPPSLIVQSGRQVVGDLGEVVFDVLRLGDDALYGYRLHVFASNDGGTWSLRSLEATLFCLRGTDRGFCV